MSKKIRRLLRVQFKAGASMRELAIVHDQPLKRVEGVIREALIKQEEKEMANEL